MYARYSGRLLEAREVVPYLAIRIVRNSFLEQNNFGSTEWQIIKFCQVILSYVVVRLMVQQPAYLPV